MKRLNKSIHVRPEFSWLDWQLYDLPGNVRSAELLNKLLADLVNAGCDRQEVERAMHDTMTSDSFSEIGAADGEPMTFLDAILDEIYA
jgi:hypothetical protein